MKTALVVGGGLVGSLLAANLARHGYKVRVFERRPDIRKAEISAGKSINLALSMRGWKALDLIGIREEVEKIAIPMFGRQVHLQNGEEQFQAYGKEGEAIYSVSRGELNAALLQKAELSFNVEVNFEWKCIDVNFKESIAEFEHQRTGEKQFIQADLIFGTDGAFSAVRAEMQKTRLFNYEQEYIPHGYRELLLPAGLAGSFQLEKNALHIWPRGRFMLIALPNSDGSFTCTLFMPYQGEHSFSALETDADIKQFFSQVFPDFTALMPDIVANYRRHPLSDLVIIRCFPWVNNQTLILGDASHAIVPFYGQGMNSGFEDCVVMDELIGKYQHNWDEILTNFQDLRKPDVDAIAELAMRNYVEMRDLVADPVFMLRKKIEAKMYLKYPDKWMPLYSQVTFSHIRYSDALRNAKIQDDIMSMVLAMSGIELNWDSPEIEQLILSRIPG